MTIKSKLTAAACALMCVLLAVFNRPASEAARQGFLLWQNAMLPALLPFFVCTGLLRGMNLGAGTYALAYISGAPGGARLFSGTNDAACAVAVLNAASPAFIISGFCLSMLNLPGLAWPILIAQTVTAALALAALKRTGALPAPVQAEPSSLPDSIRDAVSALLTILGSIVFFMVLLSLMEQTGILKTIVWPVARLFSLLGIGEGAAAALVTGIIEMASGCAALAECGCSVRETAALAAFILTFSGCCILAQSLCFVRVKVGRYIAIKAALGSVSALLAWLLTPLFVTDAPVFLQPESELASNALFAAAFSAAALFGAAVVMLLCGVARGIKQTKRGRRTVL